MHRKRDLIAWHRNWRLPHRAETGFEIAPEPRVMTEAALLRGRLERQIRLRPKPPLRFLQPKPPKRDISGGAALVEKAAPQGPQANPEPLRQIAFAEPNRQAASTSSSAVLTRSADGRASPLIRSRRETASAFFQGLRARAPWPAKMGARRDLARQLGADQRMIALQSPLLPIGVGRQAMGRREMTAQAAHLLPACEADDMIVCGGWRNLLRRPRPLQRVGGALAIGRPIAIAKGAVGTGKAPAPGDREHRIARRSFLEITSCRLQTQMLHMRDRRQTRGLRISALQRPQRNPRSGCHLAHRQALRQCIHRGLRGYFYNRLNGATLHGTYIPQSALAASGVSAPSASSTGRASHIPPFIVTIEGCSNH
jgi:hypothetical protein